jgi:hypothetical protein
MAVARASGYVDLISLDSKSVIHRVRLFEPQKDPITGKLVLNKHKKPEHFIGLFFQKG